MRDDRARRLRAAGRPAAGLAPLRRADGDLLARPGPVRRHHRLPQRQSRRPLPVPRLRDPLVQRQQAVRPVHDRAACRRPARGATDETRIASGYNRLLQTTQEGGAQAKEYMAKYAADRVRNVSTVWLGATLGCAECHDHKYDPFTTREFYSLAAFFADVKETAVGVQEPTLFPTPEQAAALATARGRARTAESDQETRRRRAEEGARRAGPPDRGAAADRFRSSLVSTSVVAAGHPRACRAATGWTNRGRS